VTAVFAHRGITDGFVENTIEAFSEARRLGADGVELDVRQSADGALVVHHDAVIEGVGPICEIAVRDLPAHVPLLDAVLRACDGLVVNVEIKNDHDVPGSYDESGALGMAVVGAITELGWLERTIISSFDVLSIDTVRAAEPRAVVGWLLGAAVDPLSRLAQASARGYQAVHPFVAGVRPELVAQAHDAGLAVNVWTVNADADLAAMVALGVDAVITDRVAAALAIAREAGVQAEWRAPGAVGETGPS
jgi:glycerophosphoryl diester phosphodiesterase